MFSRGVAKLLDETRGLLVSAAIDPLLAEPESVVSEAEYRGRAVRGRFGRLVLMGPRLGEAVAAAVEEEVLVVGRSGVTLGDRVRADLPRFRSFVERHYSTRFGTGG